MISYWILHVSLITFQKIKEVTKTKKQNPLGSQLFCQVSNCLSLPPSLSLSLFLSYFPLEICYLYTILARIVLPFCLTSVIIARLYCSCEHHFSLFTFIAMAKNSLFMALSLPAALTWPVSTFSLTLSICLSVLFLCLAFGIAICHFLLSISCRATLETCAILKLFVADISEIRRGSTKTDRVGERVTGIW